MIRVCAGILCRQGEVLICQRGGEGPFAGKWEFPGGKLASGETPGGALVRELSEELDISVREEDLRRLDTLIHRYPQGPSVELHFFEVLDFQGEPRNRVFRDMLWVPAARAADYDFLEADRGLLAKLAEGALLARG